MADKENMKLLANKPQDSLNNKENFNTTEITKESVAKHLQFMNSNGNRNNGIKTKQMTEIVVPYPKEGLIPVVNTFSK